MFDVGQQKDMLRATGNSPTEHLSCSELPGNLGKAGGGRGATEQLGARPSTQRLWQPQGQSAVFSHRHLQIAAAHPGVTPASLPLSPQQTLFYSAHQKESSLFPNCHSLFLFHPGQYRKDLCPIPFSETLKSNMWKT